MSQKIEIIARLGFGEGIIGKDSKLSDPGEAEAFIAALRQNTLPLTAMNTADCVDERQTVLLADGTDDLAVLLGRVVPQLPGGLVLAATKAASAANAAYLRDAKGFQDAYEKTYQLLTGMGYQDGGHGFCGASATVESSVAKQIPHGLLLPTMEVLTPIDQAGAHFLDLNLKNKQRRLDDGFYGRWSGSWHEDFLASKYPGNFSKLAVEENHEAQGHRAEAIYILRQSGYGFAKNGFIEATGGRQVFAYTPAVADKLARELGVNEEERQRLRLAFYDDGLHVFNGLVAKGIPVIAEPLSI